MYVLMTGGPVDGYTVYGVFRTDTEAVQYAVEKLSTLWWLMPVTEVAIPTGDKRGRNI